MDMSGWSYVDDRLSAAWRSSVQRDREGANLGLRIVFPAFRPDTATLWYDMRVTTSSLKRFPLSSPFVSAWASRRLPGLGYTAGHPFFEMSFSFTYHAWQDCAFLQPGRRSLSLPKNMQFINESRLQALSGRQERRLPLAGTAR